jgi:hypothetical protein
MYAVIKKWAKELEDDPTFECVGVALGLDDAQYFLVQEVYEDFECHHIEPTNYWYPEMDENEENEGISTDYFFSYEIFIVKF